MKSQNFPDDFPVDEFKRLIERGIIPIPEFGAGQPSSSLLAQRLRLARLELEAEQEDRLNIVSITGSQSVMAEVLFLYITKEGLKKISATSTEIVLYKRRSLGLPDDPEETE